MQQKLDYYKQIREEERLQQVSNAMERRFRESTDELRKADSEFYTNQCALEREEQMMIKKQQQDQKKTEDKIYSELWKQDMNKKIEREKYEKEEKTKLQKETLDILDWQLIKRADQEAAEKRKREEERKMLNERWKVEAEEEQELEMQRKLLSKERNLEIIRHNQQERRLKEELDDMERQRDKEMLAFNLAREAALEDLEGRERLKKRAEAKELQQHYMMERMDAAREEAEIERLTKLESDKQWEKREDQWRKEEEARIQLLREVYESRAQNIDLKKKLKLDELH